MTTTNAGIERGVTEETDLYLAFDHVNAAIGPDGTPNDYVCALRDYAGRTGRWVGWSEKYGGHWVVTGHEEIISISQDTDTFSNEGAIFPPYPLEEKMMILEQDPPEHRIYRGIVARPFSPAKVREFTDLLHRAVNKLVDDIISDGSTDIAHTIADQVPTLLTAIYMGLPLDAVPMLQRWAYAMSTQFRTDPGGAADGLAEMYSFWGELFRERRAKPGEDILSLALKSDFEGQHLGDEEFRGLCTILMAGGIDNSAKFLGSVLWHLAWDAPLRHRLRNDRGLLPCAIDEFIRFYNPAGVGRLVKKDTEFGGVQMRAGQYVLMAHSVANRDSRVFPYPDTYIVDRTPNRHLSLGIGVHRCLGVHLVRLESRIVLDVVLDRLPQFSLDPSKSFRWQGGNSAGMTDVPIIFPPGQRGDAAQ
jgi:hypothetical protein